MSANVADKGYALVSVLWPVVLLTGIAGAYHAQARAEAQLLTTTLQRAQAEALAEGGIWLAAREHFTAIASTAGRTARVTRTVDVAGTAVIVTIAGASGLINLNGAPPELLAALLAARSELGTAEQAAVVDAILDWRDSDDTRRPLGAEDPDYAALGADHGAKDAPFSTVDELRLVHGMTPGTYRAIASALTVFGNHARVNAAAAAHDVLAVLPRDSSAGFDAPADSYDQRFLQQTGEDIYSVSASATVNDVTAHIAAALHYARGEQRPIRVLAWSDSPSVAAQTPADSDAR